LREVIRVLVPHGLFVFSVWDSIDRNDLPNIAIQTVSPFFEKDPPTFYQVPFGMHDQNLVRDLLRDAGSGDAQTYKVEKSVEGPPAKAPPRGLLEGNQLSSRSINELR